MIAAAPWTALSVRRDETRALLHMAIHNPPLSVLNQTVRSELGSFFLEVQHDATVRCVVFESGERSFWAGADLREYALRFDAAVARAHVDNAH